MSNIAFINSIKKGCLQSWSSHRVLPSLVAAQAILESNWGKSGLSKNHNNMFGVKANSTWKGLFATYPTKEFLNGKWVTVQAKFRKYESIAASITDHAKFLVDNKRYKKVIGEQDYRKACTLIKAAGYATDPNYTSKLLSIINANKLHLWDDEVLKPHKKESVDKVNKFTSIVDYLNSKKMVSSFAARKNLAAKYGIKNYSGTSSQNLQLLNIMQK